MGPWWWRCARRRRRAWRLRRPAFRLEDVVEEAFTGPLFEFLGQALHILGTTGALEGEGATIVSCHLTQNGKTARVNESKSESAARS